jgi:hypothetical protein
MNTDREMKAKAEEELASAKEVARQMSKDKKLPRWARRDQQQHVYRLKARVINLNIHIK